jgi:hypothetical protein
LATSRPCLQGLRGSPFASVDGLPHLVSPGNRADMKRSLLLSLGWLVSAAGLYATLVGLELYWNLYDWQPIADGKTLIVCLVMLSFLTAIGCLARATRDRFTMILSLVLCVALVALAVYVFPSEPPTQGLFARESPSPFWYRGARFVTLALPGAAWVWGWLSRRRQRRRAGAPGDAVPVCR